MLATEMNAMCDRLTMPRAERETAARIATIEQLHADRLMTVGQLTSGVRTDGDAGTWSRRAQMLAAGTATPPSRS